MSDEKIRRRACLAPLLPALLMAIWSAYGAREHGLEMMLRQCFLMFLIWTYGGEIVLLLFCIPILSVFQRYTTIGLWLSVFASVIASMIVTAILAYVFGGRLPYPVAFMNIGSAVIPSGFIGGMALWLLNFKRQSIEKAIIT